MRISYQKQLKQKKDISAYCTGEMKKLARRKVEDSKVIEVYNTQGKAAAIKTIRTTYGVKDAYYVLRRLKSNSAYTYDSESDSFRKSSETPFMELDELCVESHEKVIKKEIIILPEKATELQFDSIGGRI